MVKVVQRSSKIFGALGIGITILVSSLAAGAQPISVGGPSDCDDNAVVRCGAHTTGDLVNKYQTSQYAHDVYASFGITSSDIGTISTNNVVGKVTNRGNVYIDGRTTPIASGAITAGRQDVPGSTRVTSGDSTFYRRATSASFQQDSLPAFVSIKNGHFQYAIIASCGNPVSATPVAMPAAPAAITPTPAPVATPAVAPAPAPSIVNNNINNNVNTVTTPAPTPVAAPAVIAAPVAAPQALPNTGPAGQVLLVILVSAAGYYWYSRWLNHRINT